MRTLAALILILVLAAPALAGPGCAESDDSGICEECREFYAGIARRVPSEKVDIGGWVLGGFVVLAFGAVLVTVLRGDRRRPIVLERRRVLRQSVRTATSRPAPPPS